MKAEDISRGLRDRSYEALFLLGGLMALSLRPTVRHAVDLEYQIGDILLRRRELEQLSKSGFAETAAGGTEGIVRLTELGMKALSGGRDPEEAWSRQWDGQWRLVLFDLPRDARAVRAKFWRWLRSSHFGRYQASVWITPDPIPEISEAAREAGLDDSMFTVFTGQVEGKAGRGREVSAESWDFDAINSGYGRYLDFGNRMMAQIKEGTLSSIRMKSLLREDRKQWWLAVKADPLLPTEITPQPYQGKTAWKCRQKLHASLFGAIDLDGIG